MVSGLIAVLWGFAFFVGIFIVTFMLYLFSKAIFSAYFHAKEEFFVRLMLLKKGEDTNGKI